MQPDTNSCPNCTTRLRCAIGLALRHVADPVVRQVRPHQHEIAGREAADVIADEHLAGRRHDQMDFVFRVKMPAHRAVRIAVRPHFERFVAAHGHEFEIGLHVSASMKRPPCVRR